MATAAIGSSSSSSIQFPPIGFQSTNNTQQQDGSSGQVQGRHQGHRHHRRAGGVNGSSGSASATTAQAASFGVQQDEPSESSSDTSPFQAADGVGANLNVVA